jgi:hypothetical protein
VVFTGYSLSILHAMGKLGLFESKRLPPRSRQRFSQVRASPLDALMNGDTHRLPECLCQATAESDPRATPKSDPPQLRFLTGLMSPASRTGTRTGSLDDGDTHRLPTRTGTRTGSLSAATYDAFRHNRADTRSRWEVARPRSG